MAQNTLPAMAVTLTVVGAVIILFPIWVRPHLLPPVYATTAVSPTSAMSMQIANNTLLPQTTLDVPGNTGAPADAWVLSRQVVNPAGRPVYSVPAGACGALRMPQSSQECVTYRESLHLRMTVTYEPASRYWAFQWVETGIYLALTLILAGLCFLRIRPGRPAEPDIHRPHAIRPAPVLERSP